mmetsp:Transcript_40961/g.86074  ORF Transcript_40961/g.86074 Transcript_40961/m.86074 type:complete len:200 (-) Transcript_40961:1005-1604(-)
MILGLDAGRDALIVPLPQVHFAHPYLEGGRRSLPHAFGKDHGRFVKSFICTPQGEGSRRAPRYGRNGLLHKTKTKLCPMDHLRRTHLPPKALGAAIHSHDAGGKLLFEVSRRGSLASERQGEGKFGSVDGIQFIQLGIHDGFPAPVDAPIVRPSRVHDVGSLVGRPGAGVGGARGAEVVFDDAHAFVVAFSEDAPVIAL